MTKRRRITVTVADDDGPKKQTKEARRHRAYSRCYPRLSLACLRIETPSLNQPLKKMLPDVTPDQQENYNRDDVVKGIGHHGQKVIQQ